MFPDVRDVRRSFLASVLVITACDPFARLQVVLTPSEATSAADRVQAHALALVDTLATRHDLKLVKLENLRHDCEFGRRKGTSQGAWRADRLWLWVCAWHVQPDRLEIHLTMPGFGWNAKGDSLRHELVDLLQARFGSAVLIVNPRSEWLPN